MPNFHPLTRAAPHAVLYRRGNTRRYGDMPRAHEELVVLLGLGGRAQYLLGEDMLTIGRGTLLWARPGLAHMLVSDSGGFDMWVCVAHPELWSRDLAELALPSGVRQVPSDAVAELEGIAGGVAEVAAPRCRHGLLWYLTRALGHWQKAAPGSRAAGLHPGVARAAYALRTDPSLPLAGLCRIAGLSRSRFGERFAAELGVTPGVFRTLQRLSRVDHEMARGVGLTRAAVEAGYGSYSQFFRDFQKARGKSPRHWYALAT